MGGSSVAVIDKVETRLGSVQYVASWLVDNPKSLNTSQPAGKNWYLVFKANITITVINNIIPPAINLFPVVPGMIPVDVAFILPNHSLEYVKPSLDGTACFKF